MSLGICRLPRRALADTASVPRWLSCPLLMVWMVLPLGPVPAAVSSWGAKSSRRVCGGGCTARRCCAAVCMPLSVEGRQPMASWLREQVVDAAEQMGPKRLANGPQVGSGVMGSAGAALVPALARALVARVPCSEPAS